MGKCQWQLWDSFYYSCLCLIWNGILIPCYNTTFMFPSESHKQLHQQSASEQNSNQLYSHLHICQCSSIVLASDYSRSAVSYILHTLLLIITFSMQKNLESTGMMIDGRPLWFFIYPQVIVTSDCLHLASIVPFIFFICPYLQTSILFNFSILFS